MGNLNEEHSIPVLTFQCPEINVHSAETRETPSPHPTTGTPDIPEPENDLVDRNAIDE